MLSAVAARKARLAQAQGQSNAETSAPPPAPEPAPKSAGTPPKPSSSAQKPPSSSKRKPSTAAAGNPPKKQKSKHRKAPRETQARYFAQPDAFKTQEDVIVVDESESAASSSDASDEELFSVAAAHKAKACGRRAWSPSAPLADSSDSDGGDDCEGDPAVLDIPVPASAAPVPNSDLQVLSTFQPVLDQNVFYLPPAADSAPKRTVLLLAAAETVTLLGAYTLTVLRGAVSLAGVTLPASSVAHPVFAPRSSPLPAIQCLPYNNSSGTATLDLPQHVADAASRTDAVLVLQELHTGVEGLGRICRTFDGFFAPSRWHRSQPRFDLGLEGVYFLQSQTPDTAPLAVPPTWARAADAVLHNAGEEEDAQQRRVYLVKGPKNAGKSTLARLVLNKLLARYRRVAYLECDLGQSEFTPGGMVSLNVVEQHVFGPPFTHPSLPFAAHYVGATSPRTSPSHYLDSIQALVQQYELDVRHATLDEDGRVGTSIPLVVNTMGWTKGLGADLARKVEEIVEPSEILAFAAASGDDELAGPALPLAHNAGGPRIHAVETAPPAVAAPHHTAADHRTLSILSYFHAIFPPDPPADPYASPIATSWNTALPLCALPPYEVDVQVAFDRLVLTGAGAEDVVPAEVHRALNCALVALVSCEPGALEADAAPLRYEQGAPPPLPSASRCVGLALVRAVSPAAKTHVQLLTPVPPRLLGEARVLVAGELQLPVWGMLDFRTLDEGGEVAGYERGRVPFLRCGKGEGAGGERRRVRRNLMRKGQM